MSELFRTFEAFKKNSNNMKRIQYKKILIYILLSICPLMAYAQWEPVKGPPGGAVYFLESYAGAYWAGSISGLYRSVDGLKWDRIENIGFGQVISGLVDQDSFYFIKGGIGIKSELLTTANGGQSWKATELPITNPEGNTSIRKAGGVLIIKSTNLLLISKDNGNTFNNAIGWGNLLDANNDWIVNGFYDQYISISLDGGSTFFNRLIATGFTNYYQAIVLDGTIVTRVQSNGGPISLKISFDTAQTWQNLTLPAGFGSDDVAIRRSGKKGLLVLKYDQSAYAWSTDNGTTWIVFSAPQVPRQLLEMGNGNWLIGSIDGFYQSSTLGANWTNTSQDFFGQIINKISASGNRLYIMTTDPINNDLTNIYYKTQDTDIWTKVDITIGSGIFFLEVQGTDTLVTYNQLSLDGGLTWTFYDYLGNPPSSTSSDMDIAIHNNKIYMTRGFNIDIFPLKENPIAQQIYGPTIEDCKDLLFVGDSLYAVNSIGHIFLQLPNTTDWIPLTTGGPGYFGRLYHINGRFFQPRWTGIRYSDNGIDFQNLPTVGLNEDSTTITTITDMVGVDSVIIASTYIGIFFSTDKGVNWWPFETGLPNYTTPVLDMEIQDGFVYTSIFRQGLWRRKVATGSSSGVVYRDDNQNGVQEPDEVPLPNIKVIGMRSDRVTLTDSTGRYDLTFDVLTDTVLALAPIVYNSVQPAYHLVSNIKQDRNFGVWLQPDITDLSITATHTAAFQPGFENSILLRLSNMGTVSAAATVSLVLPTDIEYLSANLTPDLIVGDSLIWYTTGVPLLGNVDIVVQVRAATTIPLGTEVSFSAKIKPDNTDSNEVDNAFALTAIVVGSYDPNDKQVWPDDNITPIDLAAGIPLRYTIRFQNTGTYPATRVRLVDTLDTDLDLTSLSVIGASHPFTWQIRDGHVLDILFDQIALPDSGSNEAASHGFFSFSIAGKRALPIGTPLLNQAAIYFDYNSPIYTNTTFTQVSFESAVSNPYDRSLLLSIAPNPVSSICTVLAPADGGNFSLYSTNGISLRRWTNAPQQMDINMTNLSSGIYYLIWEKGASFVVTKISKRTD
jgi:uncharacterized repeat protein (TIGR01451 family)